MVNSSELVHKMLFVFVALLLIVDSNLLPKVDNQLGILWLDLDFVLLQ